VSTSRDATAPGESSFLKNSADENRTGRHPQGETVCVIGSDSIDPNTGLQVRQYELSEAQIQHLRTEALRQFAAIASGLSDVENRVLLDLATRAKPPNFTCRASSRVLAISTGCSRSSVSRAVATLSQRGHITKRAGTATTAAAFAVNFLAVRGWTYGRATQEIPGGPMAIPGPMASPGGGPMVGPPNVANTGEKVGEQIAIDLEVLSVSSSEIDPTRARDRERSLPAEDENLFDASSVIERVLAARPKDFSEKLMADSRATLHGYATKFPVRGSENPHPPDPQVVAQFLAIADTRRLGRLLADLMADRQTCYSYGWFITVALQRIHGIRPEQWKEKREELKLMRNTIRVAAKGKKL
jgi:hypothetical protein